MTRPTTERSASRSGFHTFALYQCCQRKFFLRYGPPRLDSPFVAPPLINGGAFHAGKAAFYRGMSAKAAVKLTRSDVASRKKDFEHREEWAEIAERAPMMLDSWINEYGNADRKHLDILAVEKAVSVPMPGRPSWRYTMRLDMVAQNKFRDLDIYESKTSSWSMKSTSIGVENGDQVTGYWWGAEHAFKRRVNSVVPDITFWSSNTKNEERIVNYRGDLVFRTSDDIAFFSRAISQIASEISQKMKAVYSGHDPAIFARNSYYCNAFNRPCEFAEICRKHLDAKTPTPRGYAKKRGRYRMRELFEELDDNIAAD